MANHVITTAEQSVMQMYIDTINRIIADNPQLDQDEIQVLRATHNDLQAIMDGEKPSDILELLGTGSYKACYRLSKHFVIKFAQNTWETEREKYIYDAALDRGIGDYFVPSYHIPAAGCRFSAEDMYDEGMWDDHWTCDDDDYVQDFFDYIIIQPRIDTLECDMNNGDDTYLYDFENAAPEKWRNAVAGSAGHALSFKQARDSHFETLEQVIAFLGAYGAENWRTFLEFAADYDIRDLHTANTGWIKNHPVIIDWLSNQDEPPED